MNMEKKTQGGKVAVIQIRGTINVSSDIKDTLTMLNLERKHNCAVLEKTPVVLGMLKKVKDYATWGEITPETEKSLEKATKRGKTYLLPPPRGGFERGGIKKAFTAGGVLGYRGDRMNDLIKRMV